MQVKNLKHLTLTLTAVFLLNACSTVKNLLVEEVYEEPPADLTEFTAEFEPKVLWRSQTGEGAGDTHNRMGLWLQDDIIAAVDYEGEVSVVDKQTGKQRWQLDLDVPVITGAGGGPGVIYIGTEEGEVIALNEQDGKLLWRQSLSSEVLAAVSGNKLIVVARTSDGRVSGLSPDTGEIMWSYQRAVPLLSLRGAGRPIVIEDKVIAGYDNGKLVALSASDGKVIWERSVAVPRGRTELDRLVDIDADPQIKNDQVYAVTFHGNVAALDIETGRIVWSREMSSKTGLDVDYGRAVYISDDQSYVWAVQDNSTGDALWRQTRLIRRQISPPALLGNFVLVGDLEGYLHFMARDDGHFVARIELSDAAIQAKPLVDDGVAYILATDGSITAVSAP